MKKERKWKKTTGERNKEKVDWGERKKERKEERKKERKTPRIEENTLKKERKRKKKRKNLKVKLREIFLIFFQLVNPQIPKSRFLWEEKIFREIV